MPRSSSSTSSSPSKRSCVSFFDAICDDDCERFGGKAVNLARLQKAGLKVPVGFAISSECFSEFLAGLDGSDRILQQLESTTDLDEALNYVANLESLGSSWRISGEIKKQIGDAIATLKSMIHEDVSGYAVRSSANVEDSRHISFAGQAESFLCVNGTENVIDSVRRTWQSAISFRSALYLREMGVPLSKVKMGVIVQEMVDADISGVMFTVNTVTNDPSQIIIESTWGLGEPLVSGKVVPDSFVLQKNPLGVLRRVLGSKTTTATIVTSDQQPQIVINDTPLEKRDSFTLDDTTLLNLARLGTYIERLLGGPQDIEWCVKDAHFFVLQARPVTTMSQSYD